MSHLPKAAIHNEFPDCVAIQLHVEPVQEQKLFPLFARLMSSGSEPSTLPELNLDLTLHLDGQQAIDIPGAKRLGLSGGKATFGVRRGWLQLHLKGCRLHRKDFIMEQPFQVSMAADPLPATATAAVPGTEEPGAGIIRTSLPDAQGNNPPAKQQSPAAPVAEATGAETVPTWLLAVSGPKPILQGSVVDAQIGTLQPIAQSCQVTAAFRVRGEDVRLTWDRATLAETVPRNKLAVIERVLALKYIGPRLESGPLSKVSWQL